MRSLSKSPYLITTSYSSTPNLKMAVSETWGYRSSTQRNNASGQLIRRTFCSRFQNTVKGLAITSIFLMLRSQNWAKQLLFSSCLSVLMQQLDGFSWNLILEYFLKICRGNSSFIKISILFRMRTVSDKICREDQNTCFMFRPGRRQLTIWRMRIACWIPKATNTISEYVILIVLLQTKVSRTHFYATLHVGYIACLFRCKK